jgi:4-amino-4-deoxy-L-arabinose transferase-like glycosyltransferase
VIIGASKDAGPEGNTVNGNQRRRHAAVLLILASSLWWLEWVPVVVVTAFLLWVILHKRLEADPGEALRRRWRRVWPPATLVLIPLLLAATFVFWVSKRPLEAKVLPVALNLLALSMIVLESWWKLFARLEAFWKIRQESPNQMRISPPQPDVESKLTRTETAKPH